MTGFTGSAGIAVVTSEQAAVWTDGRYHLQADHQLDCNWFLVKSGVNGAPSVAEWLASQLKAGDHVGADPKLVSAHVWLDWRRQLGMITVFFLYIYI